MVVSSVSGSRCVADARNGRPVAVVGVRVGPGSTPGLTSSGARRRYRREVDVPRLSGRDALLPAALFALATLGARAQRASGRGAGASCSWPRLCGPGAAPPGSHWSSHPSRPGRSRRLSSSSRARRAGRADRRARRRLLRLCARYRADLWGIAAVARDARLRDPALLRPDVDERHHRRVLRRRAAGAAVRLRPRGPPPRRAGPAARGSSRTSPAAGGAGRARPDRPRAARRDRPLGQRHGRADRGRPGPGHHRSGTRPAACSTTWPSTGRRALAETARLLHVVRDDADELGLEPVPGLADVDRLVAELDGSGLEVDLAALRGPHRAAGRRRRVGVPDRAGGTHQRTALRQRAGLARGAPRGRPGPDHRRQRGRLAGGVAGRRARSARHGRAGLGAGRQPAARRARGSVRAARPCSRWPSRERPHGPDRRRPGPRPQRPGVGGRRARLRGRRYGRRRPRGRAARARARAGRGADGHPDARPRRDRGDPDDRRTRASRPRSSC